MKSVLLAVLVGLPIAVFANEDVQPENGRYNCFYQDSVLGYSFGAIGKTLGTAKGTARRECEDFLRRQDLSGQCSFIGCRSINAAEVDQ